MKKLIALLTAATVLLACGCEAEPTNSVTTTAPSSQTEPQLDPAEMFTKRDLDGSYDPAHCIPIYLDGDTAICEHPGVTRSDNTLTLKEEATYLISGSWDNGSILIDMEETAKPQLVLSNASLSCQTDAPLKILNADKVFITLAEGTTNALRSGDTFPEGTDGAVFSQQDLTFNGSGSLTVTAPTGHSIVCKDDLVFTGGSYTLNSASHGCDANDSVRIQGVQLTMETGKDGIHCENDDPEQGFVYAADCNVTINAQGDGISASRTVQIESGNFDLTTGGGSENGTKEHSDGWGDFMGGRPGRPRAGSVETVTETDSTSIKGVKAASNLIISGGSFILNTADDALHAGSISISGGSFQIASGDDGVHADEQLTITDCTMTVTESYEALEGLHIHIQGGKLEVTASDDGINAAGGTDGSGEGGRDAMFGGGRPGGPGRPGMPGSTSNGSISISGGQLQVTASGDGLDANGTLSITGGQITVTGPSHGDTATLDYDSSGTISGGTFIGTGASGMAQSFSGGEQGVIACSVGQQAADTPITLADAQGTVLIAHTPKLPYQVVILSCPQLQKGESYTLTVGTTSGEVTPE